MTPKHTQHVIEILAETGEPETRLARISEVLRAEQLTMDARERIVKYEFMTLMKGLYGLDMLDKSARAAAYAARFCDAVSYVEYDGKNESGDRCLAFIDLIDWDFLVVKLRRVFKLEDE